MALCAVRILRETRTKGPGGCGLASPKATPEGSLGVKQHQQGQVRGLQQPPERRVAAPSTQSAMHQSSGRTCWLQSDQDTNQMRKLLKQLPVSKDKLPGLIQQKGPGQGYPKGSLWRAPGVHPKGEQQL